MFTKNSRIILVNSVSADSGGAAEIGRQFLENVKHNIKENGSGKTTFIILVSTDIYDNYKSHDIKIIHLNVKKIYLRIFWNYFGINRFLVKYHIKPDVIISFTNTGYRFLSVKQIIYLHQSIPFGNYSKYFWFEWKAYIYRYIFLIWIKLSLSRYDTDFIVQTNWMRDKVVEKLNSKERQVFIRRPFMIVEKFSTSSDITNTLFYPAIAGASYKNHQLIVFTLKLLMQDNIEVFNKIKIIFTGNEDDNRLTKYIYRLSKRLKVDDKIIWSGILNKYEMKKYYSRTDAVLFPSLLESFGLPLLEASSNGIKIFSIDLDYAHDVLGDYTGVTFIPNDPQMWSKHISEFYGIIGPHKPVYESIDTNRNDWNIIYKILTR